MNDPEIRDAATVIVLRREGPGGAAVLMGRRGAGAAFMPSKFVFPGGAVDPGDAAVPVALHPGTAGRLAQEAEAGLAPALAAAAIRELWEETVCGDGGVGRDGRRRDLAGRGGKRRDGNVLVGCCGAAELSDLLPRGGKLSDNGRLLTAFAGRSVQVFKRCLRKAFLPFRCRSGGAVEGAQLPGLKGCAACMARRSGVTARTGAAPDSGRRRRRRRRVSFGPGRPRFESRGRRDSGGICTEGRPSVICPGADITPIP